MDHQSAEAGIVEHHLDDDRASQEPCNRQGDEIDGRQQGVRQHVPEHHLPIGNALEPCHLDVVACHHVDHAGAYHAQYVRRHDKGQGDDRKDDVRQELEQRRVGSGDHDSGEPSEPDAHNQHQNRGAHELRNRHGKDRGGGNPQIGGAVAPEGRDDPEQDGEWNAYHRRGNAEDDRVAEARADGLGNRLPALEGNAEISPNRTEGPLGIAGQGGTFEPEIPPTVLQPLPLGHAPQIGRTGIAGERLHTHEDDARDQHEGEEPEPQSANDQPEHVGPDSWPSDMGTDSGQIATILTRVRFLFQPGPVSGQHVPVPSIRDGARRSR